MKQYNLDSEDALEVVGKAGGSQSDAYSYVRNNYEDKDTTDQFYDYAKEYAENHTEGETFDYINGLYENGQINAIEANSIRARLDITEEKLKKKS